MILWHGTSAGVFTEWVEIILPAGQAVLADMGSAIGGQAWSSSSLPSKPTTAAAENNTAAGRVLLDSAGVAESYGSAIFTTGEWQNAGDIFTTPAGTRYVCLASATGNNGGTWTALPSGENELETGESTIPRGQATGSVTQTSELLRLAFFTAKKTQAIKHLRLSCAATEAGATPTLVQIGVYSVSESGELTLIASTANNTALLATKNTLYTQELTGTWNKVAGQRYAIGLLVVTTKTAPTIPGIVSTLSSTELGTAPRLCCAQASVTELPNTIAAGSLTNSTSIPYFVATP